MNRQELGVFALDFIDDLVTGGYDEREYVNIIFAVAHRDPDEPGDTGFAYRAAVSDESENVALLLDLLKAELGRDDGA